MNINEIEQILKNIPNELYEVPKYGKLLSNIKVYKLYVVLDITLSTGTVVARFQIFDDMDFTLRIHNMDEVINYLKIHIKNVANRIRSYLDILGFNCITL